jgi:hypothetical protein
VEGRSLSGRETQEIRVPKCVPTIQENLWHVHGFRIRSRPRCESLSETPHFTRTVAFSPSPRLAGLSVVSRFVGGKARRTQIGVALFRDGKECIRYWRILPGVSYKSAPRRFRETRSTCKDSLAKFLWSAVQYSTEQPWPRVERNLVTNRGQAVRPSLEQVSFGPGPGAT